MALMEQASGAPTTLRAVGAGWLQTQTERWEQSVMLTPTLAQAWPVQQLETLQASDFAGALATEPQVLLLATGTRLRFPRPELLAELRRSGVGLEVMDHRAAARTFNLLLGEGRKVTALFLIERPD